MEAITHQDHDPLRVVIVGGGVAGLEALVALKALAPGRVRPIVVSATDTFVYRPLLVGEPFGLGHPYRYPLTDLCRALGAELVLDHVREVAPDRHVVRTGSGAEIDYDVLLVATGAHTFPAFEHGVSFEREISAEAFDDVLADLEDGLAPHIAIVVPDGVTWALPAYELALMTSAWGERAHPGEVRVTLVTHERTPLEAFGAAASAEVARLLREEGVDVRCDVHADVVTPTALRAGGRWVEADRIVSLPRQTGPHLPGLPADEHGFIPVDDLARVPGIDDVHAAGDGTTILIKQGGLAAQQADIAATAIAARAGGDVSTRPLRPVLRGLLRTRSGPRYLRAELHDPDGTSTIADEPLWWPPSKIASRWLAPHLARLDADRRSGATTAV